MPVLICLREKLWTRTYSRRDQVPTCPVFTRAKIKSRFGILTNLPSHIGSSCPRFFLLLHPEFCTRFTPSVHNDISAKLFPYPYFRWQERGYFRFRVLANHLVFFLPFPGGSLGLLSLSPGRGYGVQIAWPIFFSSFNGRLKLTYISYFSFNCQSLVAC